MARTALLASKQTRNVSNPDLSVCPVHVRVQLPGEMLGQPPSVMEFLAAASFPAFAAFVRSALLIVAVPDSESARMALNCCRAIVAKTAATKSPGEPHRSSPPVPPCSPEP